MTQIFEAVEHVEQADIDNTEAMCDPNADDTNEETEVDEVR